MLLNLNEQKALTVKQIKKSAFRKSLIVNFIVFLIAIITLSSTWNTDSSLLEESRKVYAENVQLKKIIETTLLDIKSKNDSMFNLGLNLSAEHTHFDIDTFDVGCLHEQLSFRIDYINDINTELNYKWDSTKNVPVFMPLLPSDYDRVSDYYGWRKHPIFKRWIFHNGIDIVAKHNTNILSTADGVVIKKIRSKRGYGNRVVIDHGNGFKTLYAHLHKFNVNIGDSISRGDVIGFMGSTGLSTGTHLHYEIIKNDKVVNPLDYLYDMAKK